MNKNKYVLFIVMMFLGNTHMRANENGIEVDIFNDIENSMAGADNSEGYDEYDIESEDMDLRNLPPEEPKPVSNFQYWVRRLGSPILLKYLVVKIYIKSLWSRFVGRLKGAR
ncbi:MAG: hypothetical protein P4L31_03065 [Candidatus Babeliales bacterium]|nr:hypothetical protein [Candidatus Babeliales bacterium]